MINIIHISEGEQDVIKLVHKGFHRLSIYLNPKRPRRGSKPDLSHGKYQEMPTGLEPIGNLALSTNNFDDKENRYLEEGIHHVHKAIEMGAVEFIILISTINFSGSW